MSVDFSVWDEMVAEEVDRFLVNDTRNPARAIMAAAVLGFVAGFKPSRRVRLAEIGPGVGHDYFRYYETLERGGHFAYTGFEGSRTLAHAFALKRNRISPHIIIGGFSDLESYSLYDITISAHVLEHQPALEPALTQQLRAARHLTAINWFSPPGDEEAIRPNVSGNVHANTYRKADVVAAFEREGFDLAITEDVWVDVRDNNRRDAYAVYVGRRR